MMTAENWLSLIAILFSLVSLAVATIIAFKSWHRNRAIYDLEEFVLRKINGGKDDDKHSRGFDAINDRLKTGKYSIQTIQDRTDGDWAVLLVRIKK